MHTHLTTSRWWIFSIENFPTNNPCVNLTLKLYCRYYQTDPEDEKAVSIAEVMFDTAVLRSGYVLQDQAAFSKRILGMLYKNLDIDPDAPVSKPNLCCPQHRLLYPALIYSRLFPPAFVTPLDLVDTCFLLVSCGHDH